MLNFFNIAKAQETQKFLCFAPFCGYKILPGRWSERSTDMTFQMSRRDLLRAGVGTGVAINAFAGSAALAQSVPVRIVSKDYKEDLFYREDWLGEPWRKPDTAVLIHGNDESSIEWYAWVPRMAQDYRLIRPDLPGLAHSKIPPGFEYSLASLATFVTQVMDRAGVESAHIIGAITGDQSKMHSVEKARAYQRLIPNSRLAVIQSDAYHIAAANAEECVRLTLAFLREQSKN